MSRPIASTSAMRAPPALPREMNTSNGWPLSSSVTVTYIVPSGVAVRLGGVVREVARLGDRRIGELLEGGLHPDVPLRRDVVRRDEHALPLGRDLVEVDVARGGDPLHQIVRVPAFAPRDSHEVLVHIGH